MSEYVKTALARVTEDSLRELSRPLTSTERGERLRRDREALGLREVRGAWAHPEDHPAIKAHAAKVAARRQRKEKREAG